MAQGKAPAVLALDYAAHGAATGWRKDEHLIDALPYVDHVPPELKSQIDALIEAEKCTSVKQPSDYLKEMGLAAGPVFEGHPILKAEYERVRAKLPMPALDTTRYRLDPPPQSKRGDLAAWKQALDNANSQLEHQYLRILNQELLLKHGDKSWRAQVQLDEALVKNLEAQLAATKKETDNLNRERKLQQSAAGSELSKLEQQYMAQVRKNFLIQAACDELEGDIASMEEQLQAEIRRDAGKSSAQPQANGHHQEPQAAAEADGPRAVAMEADGPADGPVAEPAQDAMDAS